MPIDSGNLALKGLDDLFSTEENRQEEQREQVQQIPIDELHPFTNHPFKVLDDEAMTRTVESIAQYGVLSPLIARPRPEGGYEIISGHRRQYAAKLAGLDTLPVIVRQMSDDAAVILMVDSNLQREHILPSERAFAYKMKLDTIKNQGARSDLTSTQVAQKLSVEKVGDDAGVSKDTIRRFIRLTNLIPELLDMVDEKKISFNPAVELSYLDESQQRDFLEAMDGTQNAPSVSQAQQLKKMAQWGNAKDIEPFMAPKFSDNIILTKTERLMMSNRPPDPKNARNKNVLVVGGSGSGKTRFWLKPNLLQCHSSYVVTDPKGTIVLECGQAMLKNGYKVKVLNTINFKKSMHYNPFSYVHSEKDILKLVTTLMTNTKGEGSGGDPFWEKSERLLLTALIAYLHYEAPVEEQNFATLLEMLNTMQVMEDDEEYQNPVDLLFEDLAKTKPNSFAGRQYKLYKLAAGDICSK